MTAGVRVTPVLNTKSLAELIGACSLSLLMATGTACKADRAQREDGQPTATARRLIPYEPNPIIHDDLAHVDPQALVSQVRALALRSDPHAALIRITTTGSLDNGTLNLLDAGDDSIRYMFAFLNDDKGQPPDPDKQDCVLWVTAWNGRFSVMTSSHTAHLSGPKPYFPVPDPGSSLRTIWQVATASGVPADAVATAEYAAARPRGKGSPFLWTIRVDGHEEYERKIGDRGGAPYMQPAAKPAPP